MKKFSFRLFIVAMLTVLAMFAVGCSSKNNSESVVESEKQSVVESVVESEKQSVKESTSEKESTSQNGGIIGAGENGEVNLGDALELLAPVLDNDYITVNFTVDASATANQVKTTAKTQVMAFVRKTFGGYDVLATFSQTQEVQGQTVPVASVSVYYVDGVLVYGLTNYEDEAKTEWYKSEVGSFNELISQLNVMIASDEEALATYKEIMKAVEKLEIILSEGDLTNKNFAPSFAIDQYLNSALAFVLENKDQNVYEFILTNVFDVDVSNPQEVAEFESYFAELSNANPTVYAFVDMVVTEFNKTMMEQARQEAIANGVAFDESAVFQLDVEVLLDILQEQLGVTTAQFVEMIKNEFPELSDYLTEPEDGESLYDYLSVRAQMVTANDLAKAITGDASATLLTVLEGLKQNLSNVSVGAVINNLMSNLMGEEADYVTLIEQSNFSLQAFVVGVTFKTDSYGRPTELGQNNRIQASLINPETGLSTDIITVESENVIKITFNYSKPFVNFEIPQEYLDLAEDMQSV